MRTCFSRDDGIGYHIALAGTGEPFALLVDLLARETAGGGEGRVALAAVLSRDVADGLRIRLDELGVAIFPDAVEMFRACPQVNLVFDLCSEVEAEGDMLAGVPVDVPVLGRPSASLLWELLSGVVPVTGRTVRRSHAREMLMTIINGVEEDILLLDAQGRIVDMNAQVCERHARSKDELVGHHCLELEGDGFCRRDEGECPFSQTLRTGRKAEALHTSVDGDGRVFYHRIYTYPVFSPKGRLTHVVEMRRDITDRTHTEQQLQQAQKMAAIGELSTYVAHEIRNPLFAIGGFANSLLRSPGLTESEREKVGIILKESRRLETILRSMLNFARPTDGRSAAVEVNAVVEETVQLMRSGCEHHGVRVEMNLDLGVARARGVPELIKQCLINMVKNSMEAMEGGGTVRLATGMTGRWVEIVVADDGPGIPENIQNQIFNPFFSTKDKGSGLGLAMSRKIVDDLGGRLTLESRPGQGTTVTMHLVPVAAVDASELDERPDPE
ncbi:PAS domain S-box-containing protein [Desulfobaculum xiamenense]|uniref:histidine kinase n=1 Tax=Desulfobaculum xiamenense TaxID=995050 RepID=A0A846QJ82_9BACT|nr:ATP-binding protein [Desulfobaculum xiamenense]NJB68288.1 PAS domain S-box-containing protein [Desulfobaculum xiamenense]